jgi:hypothetical protein
VCVAQVQPGSTGGSIGKTDKSISGEGEFAPLEQRSRGSVRARDAAKKTPSNHDGRGARRPIQIQRSTEAVSIGVSVTACTVAEGPLPTSVAAAKGTQARRTSRGNITRRQSESSPGQGYDGFCGAFTRVVCEQRRISPDEPRQPRQREADFGNANNQKQTCKQSEHVGHIGAEMLADIQFRKAQCHQKSDAHRRQE